MNDRLHHGYAGMADQRPQARADDGLTAELAILLGPIAAGAEATPGSHHHGCDFAIHNFRFRGFSCEAMWHCRR
jgi:hypothetical protein